MHMTVATTDGESHLGVPLLQREGHELAVLLDRRRAGATAASGAGGPRPAGDDTRFVVSEPLRDLPGAWNEVPEGSWGVVRRGEHQIQTFEPITDS